MADQITELQLNIDAGPDADEEKMAELTRNLREELQSADVETVGFVSARELPEGAKAVDALVWGALLVKFLAGKGVLSELMQTLQGWLSRDEKRSVTLTIGKDKLVMTGISSRQQEQLIASWIEKHKH